MKKIASSLGVSYNKLTKDFESVSFSSLRECALDEKIGFEDMQRFIINAWKEVEFTKFVESLALNDDYLKPSEIRDALMHHTFITQRRAFYDPSREILALKTELQLGLKNPIQVIEENGMDPDELLKGWDEWKKLCESYKLNFNVNDTQKNDPIEDKTDEEQMSEDGRKN